MNSPILEAIQNIIIPIQSGFAFDSHFVIRQLLKYHSDHYIRFVSDYSNGAAPTFSSHQQLGILIKSFENTLIHEIWDYKSWSENIHGNASECTLWQRI
jgi:hypothetical protein